MLIMRTVFIWVLKVLNWLKNYIKCNKSYWSIQLMWGSCTFSNFPVVCYKFTLYICWHFISYREWFLRKKSWVKALVINPVLKLIIFMAMAFVGPCMMTECWYKLQCEYWCSVWINSFPINGMFVDDGEVNSNWVQNMFI